MIVRLFSTLSALVRECVYCTFVCELVCLFVCVSVH